MVDAALKQMLKRIDERLEQMDLALQHIKIVMDDNFVEHHMQPPPPVVSEKAKAKRATRKK